MIKLKDFLYQIENSLYCKHDCSLILSFENYKIGDDLFINEEENIIETNSLIARIIFSDVSFDLILDYPVILSYDLLTKTNEGIVLQLKSDDEILSAPMQREDIKELTLHIERILGGKERFRDIEHLFLKFYNTYKEISKIDLVHMEILISQIIRDKNNPMLPSRVGSDPEHPQTANLKQNVFNSGFIGGLAFENIGKAISTGLIETTQLEPSILEKVLMGTLVKKKEEF